ncbi:spore coat protein U domain-containing protein [Pseudomonas sp. DWP3-1-2]|jgi:spore coat protein U-like protein|uniref:spore coat protein U domain-containing protein n=1 Tax=Pseudomonas sp. DWP3-1-2 TaxID=2804645 RepID=UPI003CEC1746
MKLPATFCCLGIALIGAPAMAYDCSVAATPLNFGMVEGRTGQVTRSTATLTVVCQSGNSAATVSYQLLSDTFSAGDKTMMGGNGEASYQLYTSRSYQQVWGDTSGNAISDSYTLAANTSQTRVYTVYARMQPGLKVGPGQYTGVSTVRLIY